MTGESTDPPHHVLYWHVGKGPRDLSGVIRDGDYKLLINRNQTQLFNLKDDSSETTDLAKAEPERAERMLTEWKQWNESNVAPLWDSRRSRTTKHQFQYADYEWLKGTPHYRKEGD